MLVGKIISLVILGIVSILHIVSLCINNKKLEFITKPFIVPSILSFYLFSIAEKGSDYNWLYIPALLTAFIGDIVLLNRTPKFLQYGGWCFGCTQILLNIILFMNIDYEHTPIWMLIVIPIIFMTIGILFMVKFVNQFYENKFKFGCATIYIAVNGLSSAIGLILLITIPCATTAFYFIGAMCFFISDVILLYKRNNPKPSIDKKEIIIMVTYICAQLFIALAMSL